VTNQDNASRRVGGRPIAYLSDVEGQWSKLETFAQDNALVSLDAEGRLVVAAGALFVFGGDAIDRGPEGRRIVEALLEVKRRQPDQVILLAGNRDINKMRLVRELDGHPPNGAPSGTRAELLRWIFMRTMGAHRAFEHRRTELGGSGVSDERVADSFLEDLAPGGPLRAYLSACQLAFRHRATLFVHGAVTRESLGSVPEESERAPSVEAWIDRLNGFYARSMDAFARGDEPGYRSLVAYQAPKAGTRTNPASVVYGRPCDAAGAPRLPAREVTRALENEGLRRLVVGHTPSGDSPAVLRDEGFTLVLADNSYGRTEPGSKVLIDDAAIRIAGAAVLDGGERVSIGFTITDDEAGSPLGLVERATGRLVKAPLADGHYLLFRTTSDRAFEQIATPESALGMERLAPPPRE
jgi:hypothetical protein